MRESKKQPPSSELAVPGLDLGQIERLLSFMSEHGLEEFEYAQGDLHIRLKKAASPASETPYKGLPAVSGFAASRAAPPVASAPAPQARPPKPAAPEAPAGLPDDLYVVKSPIVGTFYAGRNPEAGPFVKVGDIVKAGDPVCIIEAMKLMNEIEAEVGGEVVQILAQNGQPVEYGEALFVLRPTEKIK